MAKWYISLLFSKYLQGFPAIFSKQFIFFFKTNCLKYKIISIFSGTCLDFNLIAGFRVEPNWSMGCVMSEPESVQNHSWFGTNKPLPETKPVSKPHFNANCCFQLIPKFHWQVTVRAVALPQQLLHHGDRNESMKFNSEPWKTGFACSKFKLWCGFEHKPLFCILYEPSQGVSSSTVFLHPLFLLFSHVPAHWMSTPSILTQYISQHLVLRLLRNNKD